MYEEITQGNILLSLARLRNIPRKVCVLYPSVFSGVWSDGRGVWTSFRIRHTRSACRRGGLEDEAYQNKVGGFKFLTNVNMQLKQANVWFILY